MAEQNPCPSVGYHVSWSVAFLYLYLFVMFSHTLFFLQRWDGEHARKGGENTLVTSPARANGDGVQNDHILWHLRRKPRSTERVGEKWKGKLSTPYTFRTGVAMKLFGSL